MWLTFPYENYTSPSLKYQGRKLTLDLSILIIYTIKNRGKKKRKLGQKMIFFLFFAFSQAIESQWYEGDCGFCM